MKSWLLSWEKKDTKKKQVKKRHVRHIQFLFFQNKTYFGKILAILCPSVRQVVEGVVQIRKEGHGERRRKMRRGGRGEIKAAPVTGC